MSSNETFVIVGAGMAGGKAAETLREEGFDGRIVLVGAEAHRPYERPPLSKDYLRGESESPAWLQEDEGWYAANDVELRASTTVESVDAGSGADRLDDPREIRPLLVAVHTGLERRVVPSVGDPRPVPLQARAHDLGVPAADVGVEQDAGRDAVPVKAFDQPPDAHPRAVVAPPVVQRIRGQAGGAAEDAGRGFVDLVVLDVEAEVERNSRTPGPPDRRPLRNRTVREELVVHDAVLSGPGVGSDQPGIRCPLSRTLLC